MNNYINIAVLLILVVTLLKNIRSAIIVYTIVTYIAPVFIIGNIRFSFDIIAFPILFLGYIIYRNFHIRILNSERGLLYYFFAYCLVTLIDWIVYKGGISFASIYAILRFAITISIIQNEWQNSTTIFVDKVFSIVMPIELCCSVCQLSRILPVSLFYSLYYKTSLTPLAVQLELGYFNRAYGTMGTPVLLGGIAAFCFVYYFVLYLEGNSSVKFCIAKLLCSVLCGLLSISKTAIISIPILTIFILMFYRKQKRSKRILKAIGYLCLCMLILISGVYWLQSHHFAISYYLSFLTDPFAAFNTRYDSESGNLRAAIETIKNHIFFGVGNANFNNAFLGDSVYVVLLYQTGLVGFVTYFYPYMRGFVKNFKSKRLVGVALILEFLLIAFGNTIHVSYVSIPFVALMLNYDEVCK